MTRCPICEIGSPHYKAVGQYEFFKCTQCNLIHLDEVTLAKIDSGDVVRTYEEGYWDFETKAAEERARGVGVARICEAIYLSSTPVENIIDIGTGTGYLLDVLGGIIPNYSNNLHGVELFPPPTDSRTNHPNYHIGVLGDLSPMRFQAGLCMEVAEHLSPKMMAGLLSDLSEAASDGACFVFNTGLTAFVENENMGYLDPEHRGHITIWTVEAADRLASRFGLRAQALPGRSWSFLVEKGNHARSLGERIHHPLPENLKLLSNGFGGDSVLSLLARSGLCWFQLQAEAEARTAWAVSLNQELSNLKAAR